MTRLRSLVRARLAGRWGMLAWLVVVWVALWGSVTVANVLGGVLAGLLVLLTAPLPQVSLVGHVRPWRVLVFVAVFFRELVVATVTVSRQVLTPTRRLHQAVVAVPIRGFSDLLVTLVGNAISLTPGTLTLDSDSDREVLYVHLLHDGDLEGTRAGMLRLERAAVRAFGSDEAAGLVRAESTRPGR